MFICKHGMKMREGTGTYYICDITKSQCRFVRWCNVENRYKPSPNFHSCQLKNNETTIKENVVIDNNKDKNIENDILEKKVDVVKSNEQKEKKERTVNSTKSTINVKASNKSKRVNNTQKQQKNKEV